MQPTLIQRTRDIRQELIAAIQSGLPLVSEPYAAIAEQLGVSEAEVIDGIRRLVDDGLIKRMGVVVKHRALGYHANAMVVWDIPDRRLDELGPCMGRFPFVTLCYHRPRHLPVWPYNLFTMIHGRDRDAVLSHIDDLVVSCGLQDIPHQALFSRRCFKQRGARYLPEPSVAEDAAPGGPAPRNEAK